MRRSHVLTNLAAVVVCACAAHVETLNSERIEQRFGSYGVEVIQQTPVLRRSNLYSTDDTGRTCRTYAIVRYLDAASANIAAPHQAILKGGSIGATFKSAGWDIYKETFYIGEIEAVNLQSSITRLMHIQASATVSVHAYRLLLSDGKESIQYATILEAHHPDYLSKDDLLEIYSHGEGAMPARKDVVALQDLLRKPRE